MSKIEEAVKTAITIANDNSHGYDQTRRNGPDYDCSSFVAYCLNKAGFPVSLSSWTGNLRKQLLACGFKSIAVNSERKRGDIFLTEGRHVVMCTSAHEIVHASINENGAITGGRTGDQTGKEICERSFYTPHYGWDYHLRYEETGESTEENVTSLNTVKASHGARYFNKMFAGAYRVMASALYCRDGAGTSYKWLTKIPKGTVVRNYGYYSVNGSTQWLYVTFVQDCVEYIGFCSAEYLEKL